MELFENDEFVPVQQEGKALDLEHSLSTGTVAEAKALYQAACQHLLHPGNWHLLAGNGTAEFNLYTKAHDAAGEIAVNDHLYIDIPLGGLLVAEEHDWVKVENIAQNVVPQADESMGITLRSCCNPLHPQEGTSHFFTGSATSTLVVKRTGNIVTAVYHGRNEKPNTTTGNLLDNTRNALVAISAMAGLSRLQWEALLKGLLGDHNEKI